MRNTRKLLLLAVMALAAVALAAPTASAYVHPEESVVVRDEPTGVVCPAAPSGCPIHATGEVALQGHFFGIEQTDSDCNVEFRGVVSGAGSGRVTLANLTNHAGLQDCQREACRLPWLGAVREYHPGANGHEVLEAEFCVYPIGDPTNEKICEVELPIFKTAAHDYEAAHEVTGGNFHTENPPTEANIDSGNAVEHSNALNCEVEGKLHIEGTPIEIQH